MNVELLQRVKAHILEEPKRFIMSRWIGKHTPGSQMGFHDSKIDIGRRYPACGTVTVACIAGWTCLLAGEEPFLGSDTQARAQTLLELSPNQTATLFYKDRWSPHYQRLWDGTRSLKKRAEIAGRVIDNFIKKHRRTA